MKAIRVNEYGGPEVLSYENIPIPEPQAGEAQVKLAAIGVNYRDVYQRDRYVYQRMGVHDQVGQLPFTLGLEGAGLVDEVGEGVEDVSPGNYVAFASHPGAYAEYITVPTWKLVPMNITLMEARVAAAIMLQGTTAHYLTHSTFPLRKGHTALVHAAAGGVGLLLVQIAKLRGSRVIGTVSTEEKAGLARSAGADEVILYTERDFATETRRLTDGEGVDVVYDAVGKDTFEQSLDSLKPCGALVLYGQASGPVPPVDLQILNVKGSLFVTRPSRIHHIANRETLLSCAKELFGWVSSGNLDVHIGHAYALEEAAEAHRALESRETTGKVLLIP